MHEHIEVIIPPTDDVEASVAKVMADFDKNNEEAAQPWWDFYTIGGRWAGEKVMQGLDREKVDCFMQELRDRGITVSAVQMGKQALQPASQIPMVDALWLEYFPDWTLGSCPLFAHFNGPHQNRTSWPDVMRLGDVDWDLKAEKVLIGCYQFDGELEAEFLVQSQIWNGCNFEITKWDGTVGHALDAFEERLQHVVSHARERMEPGNEWLCVTVDIHS